MFQQLQQLQEELTQAFRHLEENERFSSLVGRVCLALDLKDEDVADRLPVSRSVVTRWRNGTATPLPMMRKPVYRYLERRVNAALAEHTEKKESAPMGASNE